MSITPVPPPAPEPNASWIVGVLRSLTVQNVLTIALLAMVATPSYFAWKFLTDMAFRHEFMSTARIIDARMPCEVVIGNLSQKGDRHTVTVSYKFANRLEYMAAIRSQGLLSDADLLTVCQEVKRQAATMEQIEESKARGEAYEGDLLKPQDRKP